MTKKKSEVGKSVDKVAGAAVAVIAGQPRGYEAEDANDLLMPRIELLQSMSEAVQEGKGKAGSIVNQISKSDLPSDVFIPIAMQRKYIKWIARSEGGGVEYQTNDPKDPRVITDTKWGPHGEKPSCTSYLNFLVLMEGTRLPLILSFSMTNYQEGRKLYTMGKMTGQDMWLRKYKLGTKTKKNNQGTWFVFDVSEVGDTEKKDADAAEQLYNAFAKTEFKFAEDTGTTKAAAGKDEDF